MFNLDQSIAEWRQHMLAAGIKTPVPLEELESHLREDIGGLTSSGMDERKAFQLAILRVGNPGSVACEFKKSSAQPIPVVIGWFLWVIVALLGTIFIVVRCLFAKYSSLLLDAHGFSLTVGYLAALLAGGLGIYRVCHQLTRTLAPDRQESLTHAMFWFNRFAAGFVLVGLMLGMIWSRFNRGNYLPGDPRAIGTLCATVWLMTSYLVQRFGKVSHRVVALLCISGNMVVCLAWFGAGILALGFNIFGYWPLHAFLGMHLLFLILCVMSESKIVKASRNYVRAR